MFKKATTTWVPGDFRPKVNYAVIDVIEVATGETIAIKDIRFDSTLHRHIGDPTGNSEVLTTLEETIFEPTPIKEIQEKELFVCELCQFEARSRLGLSSHKRFKHIA